MQLSLVRRLQCTVFWSHDTCEVAGHEVGEVGEWDGGKMQESIGVYGVGFRDWVSLRCTPESHKLDSRRCSSCCSFMYQRSCWATESGWGQAGFQKEEAETYGN
jgi:hypothetical protein